MTTQNDGKKKDVKRRDFLKMVGAGSAAAVLAACAQPTEAPTEAPAEPAAPEKTEEVEAGMPLKGTKIKVLLSDFNFSRFIDEKKGEFTEQTGVEVETEIVTFPILLEQSEIELSAGSANYDVMWQVFIKAQRWMRAGWSTPLDDYIKAANFDMSDFIPSTIDAMVWEGVTYGIPFLAESTEMIYRRDKLEEAGLEVPQTFDALGEALAAIHAPEDFYGWVMRTEPNGVHFPLPIWIQGYGGNIFRDPPNDLTPTLNTAEALAGVEDLTSKIMQYSIAGSQIYGTPDCQNVMAQGQAGFWVDALGIFSPITNPESSQVADKVEITLPPGGPGGQFPQIATHGLQIPAGSEKKDAAWEFIAWATSQDFMMRSVTESGYSAVNRKSILTSDEYAAAFNKGETNIGQLVIDSLALSKCAYRVVPEFPEVGRRMGQAIGEIISEQKTVQEAMDSCQADCEQIMIQGGNEIST
jgi:ABC-type glycerol-3-phosphate transport system substrate-binding protein